MQQGGVIMDVVDPEQAAVAEDSGAVAVMALERNPSGHKKSRRSSENEPSGHDSRNSRLHIHSSHG